MKAFRAFLLLAVALLAALALAAPADAQGGIELVSAQAESQFPDGVLFKAQANSPSGIQEIKVLFKTPGGTINSYGYMTLQGTGPTSGEYLLRLSGNNHVPPGTLITYSLEVRDNSGALLQTQEQDFLYMDNRFQWGEVSREGITVYYYGPTQSRAEAILDMSLRTREAMNQVLGVTNSPPVRIVAYNNIRHMSAALPFRSQAVREDLVTEGQAWPDHRVLLVLALSEQVLGITAHEFTHIIVYDATAPSYGLVPAWLNEGLAEYANPESSENYDQAIEYAIYTRRLPPIWQLSSFGGSPDDIIIAYGVSKWVVTYLAQRYGHEKLAELMSNIRRGLNIDEALRRTYGFDQYGLDAEWRQAIGLRPLPSPQPGATSPAPTPEVSPTPTPEPTPTATPVRGARSGTPAGCNRGTRAAVPLELAMLGLLLSPALLWPVRRMRWPGRRPK